MFFNLFGRKKNDKKDDLTTLNAIYKLKETLNLQQKKEEFLEKNIEKLKNEAREYVKTNKKSKAISALKLCKLKEKNLEQLYGIKINLENQICSLEQTVNNEILIKSIKHGKNALDTFKSKYDVDDTAELMDDINEHMVISTEIGDILSQPIGNKYDDDELLNELKEEDEINYAINLPKIEIKNNDDEKELKELEQEFAFPSVPTKPIKIKEIDLS